MMLLLLKDQLFQNLLIVIADGVKVLCGGPESLPYFIMVQIIFSGPLGSMS